MSAPVQRQAAAPALLDEEHRASTIGVVSVMLLVAFEGIATATAMPVVARALNGLETYAWAFSGYVVTSLLGMVLAGTSCDRFGPARSMIRGVVAFAAGATLAGAAPTMTWLIAGRAVQGLGGGAVVVAIYVLIAARYPESLRPRAFSSLAAAWVVPALIGPVIAGTLADHVSWRAVFFLVPLFVIPPSLLLLPSLRGEVFEQVDDSAKQVRRRRARVLSGLLAAGALALLQDGAERRGGVGAVEALIGLGLLPWPLRSLLPTRALTWARGLPATVMMRGLMAGSFFAAETFIPLALVELRGLPTAIAGGILTVGSLGWAAGSALQGRIPAEADRARLVQLGALATGLGIGVFSLTLLPAIPVAVGIPVWVVAAFGMGVSFPSIAVQAIRLTPPEDSGATSSALQICDSVGSVLLIGAAGAVHAAAVATGGAGPEVYRTMWFGSAAVLLAGAVLAARMRPNARAD